MSSREVIRRLRKEGWTEARQRGSHVQFKHPGKRGARVTVIHPKTSLSPKTLRAIFDQAGWDWSAR